MNTNTLLTAALVTLAVAGAFWIYRHRTQVRTVSARLGVNVKPQITPAVNTIDVDAIAPPMVRVS